MSVGKFVAGTTLATPAIGGAGYITYSELTKEENTIDTNSGSSSTDNSEVPQSRKDSSGDTQGSNTDDQRSGVEQGTTDGGDAGTKSPQVTDPATTSTTGTKATETSPGSISSDAGSLGETLSTGSQGDQQS